MNKLAVIKRFVDCWLCDEQLRARVRSHPDQVEAEYALPEPLSTLAPFWGETCEAPMGPVALAFAEHFRQRRQMREQGRALCAPEHPGFRAWRERQMARCRRQLQEPNDQAMMHLPVAFELSQGCSVGCWFCGFSAPRLREVFAASAENRQLWRQVLEGVRQVAGPAAGRGICFWATDPLDNPDYELFCRDFHEVLGRFPNTTTALAHKHTERTRRLLEESWQAGCEFNRFSVLTLGTLKRLHQAFSPEELLRVDIVPQMAEAFPLKARAGRAQDRPEVVQSEASTIACVSGFLISLPARRAQLISPCGADERWPLGYRIHSQTHFADGPELAAWLLTQVREKMPMELERDRQVPGTGLTVLEWALAREREGVPLAESLHRLDREFERGEWDEFV